MPQLLSTATTSQVKPYGRLACTVSNRGVGAAWIHVSGELDISTSPELERTLTAAVRDTLLVVLDLSELGFIDSAGVHAIVAADATARAEGRRLVVLPAAPLVHAVFTVTGAGSGLTFADAEAARPHDPRNLGDLELEFGDLTGSWGQARLVACHGEIDVASAPLLNDALTGFSLGDVIVDLGPTTAMDITGVSVLLNASRRLTRHGHRLAVICPPGDARDPIQLANLIATLRVAVDRAGAELMLSR